MFKSGKFLFLNSLGMKCLAFMISTGIEKQVKVINYQKEGTNISNLKDFDLKKNKYSTEDFFLDNITGDMYYYNKEKDEWVCKINAGLHNRLAQFNIRNHYKVNLPLYLLKKAKNQTKFNRIYKNKINEEVIFIRKVFSNYYLFQDMQQMKFVVSIVSR